MVTTLAPNMAAAPIPYAALNQLSQANDHYGVLAYALPISANCEDPQLALLVIRSLLSLGLIGPAREMLANPRGPLAGTPECAALLTQLSSAPSGVVAWASLSRRFEANLVRLFAAHPHLREKESELRDVIRSFDLFRSNDGQIHLSRMDGDGVRQWMPLPTDVRKLSANVQAAHEPSAMWCTPYVIAGDWQFAVVDRIFDATSKFFMTFQPRLYVFETELAAFAASLHIVTNIEKLCHPRVQLFVGDDAAIQLGSLLNAQPLYGIPGYSIFGPTAARDVVSEQLEGQLVVVMERRKAGESVIAAEIEKHYSSKSLEDWSKRYANSGQQPLRVLGITSRYTTVLQYAMRDLQAAFCAAGHDFQLIMEPSDHDLQGPPHFARMINDVRPDLIFLIDHHRAEYAGYMPTNVPYIGWVQDMLPNLTRAEAGRAMGALDFYVAPALYQLQQTYDYPRQNGMVWTMATSEAVYRAEPMDEAELAPHRCDFSFVSNQSMPAEIFHEQFKRQSRGGPAMDRLCDYLFSRLREEIVNDVNPGAPRRAMDLIAEATKATGLFPANAEHEDAICIRYLHPLAELMFRQHTLTWVADYCERTGRRLHLYGQGWEQHPRFARYAKGVAANGAMLRAIHQATCINLQINGYGAVHQRLLDGVASGGFFMIRRSPLDLVGPAIQRFVQVDDGVELLANQKVKFADYPKLVDAFKAEQIIRGGKMPLEEVTLSGLEIALFREIAGAGYRRIAGTVFDDFGRISFDSRAEFEAGAEQFLNDPSTRKGVMESMHSIVLSKFTYRALVNEVLEFVARRLRELSAA